MAGLISNGSYVLYDTQVIGNVYTDSSLSGNGSENLPLGLSKEDYDLTLGNGLTYNFNDEQKTVALDLAVPVRIVNDASEATDTGVLYVVTGTGA